MKVIPAKLYCDTCGVEGGEQQVTPRALGSHCCEAPPYICRGTYILGVRVDDVVDAVVDALRTELMSVPGGNGYDDTVHVLTVTRR